MSRRRALPALGLALVVSLIANALLAGLIIGNTLGRPDHSRGPRGGGEEFRIARAMGEVVPEATREEMRSAFRGAFRNSRGLWQDKRAAREALTAALAAEPFDRAAVDAAFAEMRTADQKLTENFQAAISEQLAELTPSQRAELVDWMEEMEARREARRERRRERRGGPPPGGDRGDGSPRR